MVKLGKKKRRHTKNIARHAKYEVHMQSMLGISVQNYPQSAALVTMAHLHVQLAWLNKI